MQVIDTRVEVLGPNRIQVVTTIDIAEEATASIETTSIGSGPTGAAIPDRIVEFLIAQDPKPASISEIQKSVGGNPATVQRQAWTLATNAPDLQRRLRGWVVRVERGRYALTRAAKQRIAPER